MAQERQKVDLVAFNTRLRKANIELAAEKKYLSSKLAELKSKNEELEESYVELIMGNAKIIGEVDSVEDKLAKEKAENASLKAELETTVHKVQTIAVDTVLRTRAELMEEFKKGEHASSR